MKLLNVFTAGLLSAQLATTAASDSTTTVASSTTTKLQTEFDGCTPDNSADPQGRRLTIKLPGRDFSVEVPDVKRRLNELPAEQKCMMDAFKNLCEETSEECKTSLELTEMCTMMEMMADMMNGGGGGGGDGDFGSSSAMFHCSYDMEAGEQITEDGCKAGEYKEKCVWTNGNCAEKNECNVIDAEADCTLSKCKWFLDGCVEKDCTDFETEDDCPPAECTFGCSSTYDKSYNKIYKKICHHEATSYDSNDSGGSESESEGSMDMNMMEDPAEMCASGCMQVMVDFMGSMATCAPADMSTGPSASEISAMLDAMCAQNWSGEYCGTIFNGLEGDDDAKMCVAINSAGCCLGTAVEIAKIEGVDAAEINADLTKCGITTAPPACPGPGDSIEMVETKFELEGVTKEALDALSPTETADLKKEIAEGIAKDAGVDLGQVEVKITTNADGTTSVSAAVVVGTGDDAATISATKMGASIKTDDIAKTLKLDASDLSVGEASNSKVEVKNDNKELAKFVEQYSAAFGLVPAAAACAALFF